MAKFKGFIDSETFTQLPDGFFHQLLKDIKDTDELKVAVYFLWRVEHMEGPFRALCETDFDVKALGLKVEEIQSGLEKAVKRGSISSPRMKRMCFTSSTLQEDALQPRRLQTVNGGNPQRSYLRRRWNAQMCSNCTKRTSVR